MILVIGVLIQTACASVPTAEDKAIVLLVVTDIVPVVVILPHPPVRVTVYVNGLPTVVLGEPLIVTTFAAHEPFTPAGKPVTVAPVAPVVV